MNNYFEEALYLVDMIDEYHSSSNTNHANKPNEQFLNYYSHAKNIVDTRKLRVDEWKAHKGKELLEKADTKRKDYVVAYSKFLAETSVDLSDEQRNGLAEVVLTQLEPSDKTPGNLNEYNPPKKLASKEEFKVQFLSDTLNRSVLEPLFPNEYPQKAILIFCELQKKLLQHNYVLNGGGTSIDGKKYSEAAGNLMRKLEVFADASANYSQDQADQFIEEAMQELKNKRTPTKGSFFFGMGGRDESTAKLYSECYQLLQKYVQEKSNYSPKCTL